MKSKVINNIKDRKIIIGVIGMGYVGMPLAMAFCQSNIQVIGFDIDLEKVQKINNGQSYFKHIDQVQLNEYVSANLLRATSDFSELSQVDAIILCVPTPLNQHKEPDLSYVINTMETILPHLKKGQILSLESTTYPGTTEEELKTRIENAGYSVGEDIFLIYSPEREDPGNINFSTRTIPKVVGGITEDCLEVGVNLYGSIVEQVVPVSSTKVAELSKLLENIYRAVNIGLVNEIKIVADKMGIDIWEVIEAAATKPFGFTPFYPGPGWGGHCIPIDPFYLTWKAKEYGVNTKFIELSGEINTNMPEWVLHKIMDGLNERGKPLKNSKVLILGISYKKNVNDMRESPAVKLMELLREKRALIYYSDPYVPKFPKMREHFFDLESIDINANNLKKFDCVIITTNHDVFDYNLILKNSDLIIDTRGVYRKNYEHVVKA